MEFTYLYQTTLITEMPSIINNNFQAVSNYLDVFYDETNGVIISPVNTPGRVKGGTGEFVSLIVDNLIVKSQYTNLYENITTANYDYWVTYTGVSSVLRDACTSEWENTGYKYIDVEKPYYKIIPYDSSEAVGNYYAFQTDLKSQLVQIILDPSGVTEGYYRILMDADPAAASPYLDITINASMLAEEQTKYITLFCLDWDASYGAQWEVYEYGSGAPGTGTGTGGGVTAAYVAGEITAALRPYATNASVNTALISYATNVSVNTALISYATNVSVNTALTAFATNVSVNTAFGVRDASISFLFNRNSINESSIGVITLRLNITDASLYALTNRVNVIDTSISYIKATYIPNASLSNDFTWNAGSLEVSLGAIAGLELLASNASVNLAFLTNVSLGNLSYRQYTTEVSLNTLTSRHNVTETSLGTLTSRHNITETSLGTLNTSLLSYATNASVGLAFASNSSLGTVSQLTISLNSSIGLYTTNVSVNSALVNYTTFSYVDDSLNNLRAVPVKDTCLGGGLSWTAGKLYVDISTVAGGVTLSYVDSSLIARDAVISTLASNASVGLALGAYATNVSVGLAFASNASLGILTSKVNYIDACLGPVSSLTYALNSSMGSGLGVYATNASVNLAFLTNTSLGILTSKVNYIDACLGPVSSLTYALNSSMGSGLGDYATNASVNTTINNVKATYIPNVSLSNDFVWNGGSLEVSLGAVYGLDLLASNASVNLAFLTNVSLGNLSYRQYITEASLNTLTSRHNVTETSLGIITGKVNYIDPCLGRVSSLTYALNSSMGSGLGAYATNASVNTTINNVKATYIPNASLNVSKFKWVANYLEPSTSNITSLSALSDVSIVSVVNNSYLKYDSSWNKWVNTISEDASTYFYTKTEIDGSFASKYYVDSSLTFYATNVSVNTSLLQKQNIGDYIKSASLGTTLYWNVTVFDVSLSGSYATFAYVDGSLLDDQNQINALSSRVTALESATGQVTREYVDGSLASRDASITYLFNRSSIFNTSIAYLDSSIKQIYPLVFKINSSLGQYSTNASVNVAFSSNASIGRIDASLRTIYPLVFKLNSSFGYLDSSLKQIYPLTFALNASTAYYATNVSVNSAVSILSGSISTLNSQMSTLTTKYNITETSLGTLTTRHNITETSLGTLTTRHNITETSLGALTTFVSSINSSLGILEASLNDYVDAYGIFIPEASLNDSYFKWTGGYVEPSVSGVTSLSALTDVSIVDVSNNDYLRYNYSLGKWVNERTLEASLYYYTKTQVDASFALKADVEASLNNTALLWSYVNSSSYVDGSLNLIWAYLNDYIEASTLLANYISDASLSDSYFRWNGGYLEVSVSATGDYYTKTQIDASFALITDLTSVEASLNDVMFLSSYVNTSSYYDGSLNNIRSLYATNVSVNTALSAYATNASVNLAFLTNVSLGYVNILKTQLSKTDTSLYLLSSYVDACLGDYIDISTLFYTKTEVDASFALKTNVEASLNNIMSITSYVNTSSYYDGSLNTLTQKINTVNASISRLDASLSNTFLLSSYVNTSSYYDGSINSIRSSIGTKTFQTLTVTDVSTTWNMTLGYNAKVTLTKDISLNVINQVSGESGNLIVIQDTTGGRLIKLPIGSCKNNAWTLSTDANAKDIISFLYDGSYYWNKGGPYA